jgi:ssDNA-specific exonuclease RecJ
MRTTICNDIYRIQLVAILWELGIDSPIFKITKSIDTIIFYLRHQDVKTEGFTPIKAEYYYKWIYSGISKEQMCNIIKEALGLINHININDKKIFK